MSEKKCENIALVQILLDSGAIRGVCDAAMLDAGRAIRSEFVYDFDSMEPVHSGGTVPMKVAA